MTSPAAEPVPPPEPSTGSPAAGAGIGRRCFLRSGSLFGTGVAGAVAATVSVRALDGRSAPEQVSVAKAGHGDQTPAYDGAHQSGITGWIAQPLLCR